MTVDESFWQTCTANGVIVVPFQLYDHYAEHPQGYSQEEGLIGLRFVALRLNPIAVYNDFFVMVDDASTDMSLIALTPAAALDKYLRKRDQ